jgi:hypothetical protein
LFRYSQFYQFMLLLWCQTNIHTHIIHSNRQNCRTVAQAVSRWLPTAAARVRFWGKSCGICGGQSHTGVGFLLVLRLPPAILTAPNAQHSSSSIIRGWYNRPNSGRCTKWTQSHPTPRNLKKLIGTDEFLEFVNHIIIFKNPTFRKLDIFILRWKVGETLTELSPRGRTNLYQECRLLGYGTM